VYQIDFGVFVLATIILLFELFVSFGACSFKVHVFVFLTSQQSVGTNGEKVQMCSMQICTVCKKNFVHCKIYMLSVVEYFVTSHSSKLRKLI